MTPKLVKLAILTGMLGLVSACEDGIRLPGSGAAGSGTASEDDAAGQTASVRLVERDVEAPDVFQITETGLWDGRPSLGGVWVAHPDVKDPERVIIRNEANSKFVIGALFRRERDNPGPRVQVSSDAAEALGLLAGQPVKLNVTALRREEVDETPDPAAAPASGTLEAPEKIEALSLDGPNDSTPDDAAQIAAAAATAIQPAAAPAPVAAATPAPAPKPAKPASGLKDAFIQIGIFSVETNAKNTAVSLRNAGMIPSMSTLTAKGKTFYRVMVGPATTSAERASLLKKVKALGFTDAYFTSN